ncbi:MAG: serpin family protein [Tannerella sp.]|jgi:serpin B|nr:serpin family protein [Tannerella sp.]
MKKNILLFSLSCFLAVSCENPDVKNTDVDDVNDISDVSVDDIEFPAPIFITLTDDERTMTGDCQDFAMKFFSTVYGDGKEENIFVSPFSMSMALGVLRNGAEGETKREMQEVLGMKDFSDQDINAYYKKLKEALITTDPTLKLAIANSVWYNKDRYMVKSDFADLSRTWFDTQITGLDYSDPAKAVATVNKWCEDNTNGLIKDMLKNLMPFEILNALYFKGDWSESYDFDVSKTKKEDFTKEDGSKIKAELMNNKLTLPYYEDDYLSLTSVPYGNKAYSMYFVLPKENVTFSEMTAQLAEPDYWKQCLAWQYSAEVDISVPKFKIEYKNEELKDILSRMGMEIACSPEAEYPHIANAEFIIARITQKTYIQVDEKGTEAAAVTEIGLVESAGGSDYETPKKTFRADRTFLFLIQERYTGTILFMGKVGNPAE